MTKRHNIIMVSTIFNKWESNRLNNYAISTDELATALQKSSATLSLMGNTIDEAASLVTTANATIQDADSVSAGLRTISLRLVGTEEAKEELSDLGEETDGMITTVSKLRDTIMDATKAASSDGKGFDRSNLYRFLSFYKISIAGSECLTSGISLKFGSSIALGACLTSPDAFATFGVIGACACLTFTIAGSGFNFC